ncbi:MAG: divalent-cation tolerance protein CutA [Hyphomicrobiaceae bacterium]
MPEKISGVNEATRRASADPGAESPAAVVLVYATFPDMASAECIAGELVQLEIAACVNLIPAMRSFYRWQGKVETADEVVGIIKTPAALAERVIAVVRVSHPYTNPALVVLPVIAGSPAFLEWIGDETCRQR